MFLKDCICIENEKKMIRYITDNQESSSDGSHKE